MHWRRLFVESLKKMSWRGPIHSPRSRHNPKEAKKPQKNTKQNTKHNPNPKNKQNQKHTREKVIGWPVQQRQIDGEEWYSDRGKDRMSVWKTAMICFFGQMQGKTPHSKWRHPVFPFITTVRMTSFLRFRLWLCGMCGELCILATTDRMTTKQMPKPLHSPNPLDSSRKVSFSPCHPYPSA